MSKKLALFWLLWSSCFSHAQICIDALKNVDGTDFKTLFLFTPVSGAKGLKELAKEVLPPHVNLVVFYQNADEIPDQLPANSNITYRLLPKHIKGISHFESLNLGLTQVIRNLGEWPGPARVIVAGEYSVDWGNVFKKRIKEPSAVSQIEPHQLVSKSAIAKFLRDKNVRNLKWPLQFTEGDFEGGLKEYAAKSPESRLVIKYDNSSGMSGFISCRAEEVFGFIEYLKSAENRHGRAKGIIVEEYVDDIPLSEGKWVEMPFDAVTYKLPGESKIRVKFFMGWRYKKTDQKMYLSDTIFDPNNPEYEVARQVIEDIVNELGYQGGLHFEMYLAVNESGRVVRGSPIVLGDANFRFGGNGKYANTLLKNGIINYPPNELLLLSTLNPKALHELQPLVKEGHARVVSLSFQNAPFHASFSEDPTPIIQELNRLVAENGVSWSSDEYVGRSRELKHTKEVLLIGPPQELDDKERGVRILEEALGKLMVRP